ncbi:Toxin co-regulated pilus biosynthesis protein Q [compost metagenome]
MLHGTLSTWAEATGWKVIWNSEHDYLIEANATFSGDFVKASSDLIKAMADARPQITVDYYQGNKVIVISNKLSDEVNR